MFLDWRDWGNHHFLAFYSWQLLLTSSSELTSSRHTCLPWRACLRTSLGHMSVRQTQAILPTKDQHTSPWAEGRPPPPLSSHTILHLIFCPFHCIFSLLRVGVLRDKLSRHPACLSRRASFTSSSFLLICFIVSPHSYQFNSVFSFAGVAFISALQKKWCVNIFSLMYWLLLTFTHGIGLGASLVCISVCAFAEGSLTNNETSPAAERVCSIGILMCVLFVNVFTAVEELWEGFEIAKG